ncbi:C-terminal domain of homeodomain 1-domain-containing protein [Lyophyllum atratum]|nr:C-terminal domain of homeodomain 1-domain-containing protein [Lyophyllum atratum]
MDDKSDGEFLHRLSSIEHELLNLNRASLDSFNRRWTTLVDDFKAAMDAESLSVSTIKIAHILADRVSQVVQTFLDLELLAEKLMSSLLEKPSAVPDNSTDTPTNPSQISDAPTAPSYIKPSYNWLLESLHNPYPSIRVRDGIAQKSAAGRTVTDVRKDVDNWFIDARKRIGWNALRRSSFANKRVEIVDAATRFFVEEDPKRPVDPAIEYELMAIKKRAKDLYVDKFFESDLAARLDMAVKTLTPQTKAEAKAEQLRQWHLQKDAESYPSPDRSPEPTRISPVPYNDEGDTHVPQSISITSRKRRSPSADPESNQPSVDRPAKRSRLDTPSSSPTTLSFPIGLPSPAYSIDEPLQPIEALNPAPVSASLTVPATSNRKRRLSGSDGQGAPKRPRNMPVGPRLHAVSDPLPLSSALFDASAFDGWFQQHFDLQAPPKVGEISPSGFDVELGNFSDFECEAQAESAGCSSPITPQSCELVTAESTELQVPNLDLLDEFSFGLQSFLASDSATAFPEQAQDFSFSQMPSLGLDLLNNFGDSFHIPPQAASAVDPSMTSTLAFDFQLEFSDFLNMGPQDHASRPDVPQSNPAFFSPDVEKRPEFLVHDPDYLRLQAQAARTEKEMKLKKMKEEALRLEMELAASP